MRLKARVADAEFPFEPPAVDTVPAEIINFVPDTVRARHGQTLVHGRVPAVAAVSALGLNQLLLEDGAPTGSLSGHLGVTARLDNNGCLEYVEFFGENTRIKGSTKDAPSKELDAVIRASLSRLFISAVNSPQTITVPDPDSLIGSERV
jgi:hypothetical protein